MSTDSEISIRTHWQGKLTLNRPRHPRLPLSNQRTTPNLIQNSITKSNTRAFATANDKYSNLPEVNQNHGTSIPPVTPLRTGDTANHTSPTSQNIAREFRKVSGKVLTETYTAFGATEELYKSCGAQADYSIPQALDPDAEMPKTEDGEDLGIGKGWWHDRECSFKIMTSV